MRARRPLALAELVLDHEAVATIDLDDPRVLVRRGLRPSQVATRIRSVTQRQAAGMYDDGADVLLWWSTLESGWRNATVLDRAATALRAESCTTLAPDHPVVVEAAAFLGLRA